ncbi:Ger(x)C family spore germination protein [Paenibacillus sp. y28]|uniref:Ger(x)C family spore germination protein n=1 Tax=Paenibacillus sp. y28 TaxID=3129110 RepID=UPI0030189B9A
MTRLWRKGRALCAALLLIVLLGGCWNSKDIQNLAYVTAIGFDYADGKFISYVQVLNFTNVAKTEAASLGKSIPIWIGRGEGTTVSESFNDIYATSQIRVFWGHVKAIVLTENMMRQPDKMKEAYDMVNRYREIRYNVLLYGTKEPLRDLFTRKSILNLSPLDTLMYTPGQIYTQRSFILPVYGYKVIAMFNEPSEPVMIPSLSSDMKGWSMDKEPRPMIRIDGAYFIKEDQLAGWLGEQDLQGYRWLQKRLMRTPITVPDKQHPAAVLVMVKPQTRIRPLLEDGNVFFTIEVKIKAYVDELIQDTSEKSLEEQAAEVIRREIQDTYRKGLAIQTDVLQLDEVFYRDNPGMWKRLHEGQPFLLKEDSIRSIEVQVDLLHTGKYKGRIN